MRIREILKDLDDDMEAPQRVTTANSAEIPMIRVNFGKFETRALIDTGAQISAITQDVVNRVRHAGVPSQIIPIRKIVLRGAFSERGSAIAAKIRITMTYDGHSYEHEFCIVEELAFDIEIGIDFLRKYNMSMKCDGAIRIRFE